MTVLTKDNFAAEVSRQEGLVVIDLYADWCAPCRMLAPVIAELEAEHSSVKFCKANIDEQPELAEMFKVESIPMVALVKDDTFVDLSVGYVPKEKLAALIEQYK